MDNWQDEIIKAQISQEIGVERSMENSDISVFLKSFKENLIGAVDRDSFDKSWSSDLQSKFPSGGWKTLNGARVFVNNGKVVAGLDGFNGEIDKFFDGKGKKGESKDKKEDKGIKVKRKFDYNGSEIRIVEREEDSGDGRTRKPTRVLAPNGDPILVNIEHKETLRSIEDKTRKLLDGMKKRGLDVDKELAKKDGINFQTRVQNEGNDKKETSKPQLSPDQKKAIDSISKLTVQSKELNKKQVYNPKTFEISKETLKDMVGVSSQIDEKVLSRETREKLDEIKEELDNFVTKDIYVQMPSGRKGKYLNRDKDFESDLEDKETLSDKIKFIVDEYDKEDGDGNTEIVGIDEFFPKVKDLLVDIVKEYSNKKTTEILNYKLF